MIDKGDYFIMEKSRWKAIGRSWPSFSEDCINLSTFVPCAVPAVIFNINELRIADKKACWSNYYKKIIFKAIE